MESLLTTVTSWTTKAKLKGSGVQGLTRSLARILTGGRKSTFSITTLFSSKGWRCLIRTKVFKSLTYNRTGMPFSRRVSGLLKEGSTKRPIETMDRKQVTSLMAKGSLEFLFILYDNGWFIGIESEIELKGILLFTPTRSLIAIKQLLPKPLVQSSLFVKVTKS